MNNRVLKANLPDKDERTWGMLCHLSAFSAYFIPFAGILAPLIIWLIKKDEMPFVDDQGKESLNYQLTLFVAVVISIMLCVIFIGFLMLAFLAVYNIIILIVASIKANDGIYFRYPHTIRFLK